jgi:hypothetical protein
MSDSNTEQRLELECLRLASDLVQLSTAILNPDLKAHILRMAADWTDQAVHNSAREFALPNYRLH